MGCRRRTKNGKRIIPKKGCKGTRSGNRPATMYAKQAVDKEGNARGKGNCRRVLHGMPIGIPGRMFGRELPDQDGLIRESLTRNLRKWILVSGRPCSRQNQGYICKDGNYFE